MSSTGRAPSSLSARLTTKLSQDRQQIEELTLAEQKKLAANLETASKDAFAHIRSVIDRETLATTRSVRKLLRWPLWTAAICVILVAISLTVLWATTWWFQQDLIELRAETQAQRRALQSLTDQTGGIEILTATNGTFVILPKGTDLDTVYTCRDERSCLKLPR